MNKIEEEIKNRVRKIKNEIIEWYRFFHQYPEPGFKEFKTSEKIQSLLKNFKIPYQIKAKTGVVGYLKGKGKKTIGIRADMDALPVEEKTSLPYKSKNKGFMHACGHDGHMAILLGVIKILSEMKNSLNTNIKFIFQPSEEKPPGGAKKMVEEGVIDDVDYLLGYHLLSILSFKKIWIGKGPVMANTDLFKIEIKGKGGHGSTPHLTNDPITCSSYLISSLQTIVSRRIDPLVPSVVSIGKISGGDAFNVIPDKVEILGTVRTLSEEVREKIKKEIENIVEKVCLSFNCSGEIDYNKYSPVCKNDEFLSEKIIEITKKHYRKNLIDFHPIMGGEDFAFFSQKVPSCYIFIGIGENCGSHHSPTFKIDERILPFAVEYLTSVIFSLNSQ